MYTYGHRIISSMKWRLLRSPVTQIKEECDEDSSEKQESLIAKDASGLRPKKRKELHVSATYSPPQLLPSPQNGDIVKYDDSLPKSLKRAKTSPSKNCEPTNQFQSPLFGVMPHDVFQHTLSFLSKSEDRFSLQLTCRQFHAKSNTSAFLKSLDLYGNVETGRRGILRCVDGPEQAIECLLKYAFCGNKEAIYMIGMIKSYCHDGTRSGVSLLKIAAGDGCLRSSYALGLILRDSSKEEAKRHLSDAANGGFLPALQELVSAQEMKALYGDLDACRLRRYLDPIALNRLLGSYYLHCNEIRKFQSSHCWNPLCGRWAFKASSNNVYTIRGSALTLPPPPPMAPHIETSVQALIKRSSNGGGNKKLCTSGVASHDVKSEGCVNRDELNVGRHWRVSRMKMCSSCRRAKYCSKLCQVYDWRSGRHKSE